MNDFDHAMARRERDLLLGVYLVRYGFIDPRRLGRAAAYWRTEPGADLGWVLVREGLVVEQAVHDVRAFLEHEIAARGTVRQALQAYGGDAAVVEAFAGLVPALPVKAAPVTPQRPPVLTEPVPPEPAPTEPDPIPPTPEEKTEEPWQEAPPADPVDSPHPEWGGSEVDQPSPREPLPPMEPMPLPMSESHRKSRWPWLVLGGIFAVFLVVIGLLVVYQLSGASEFRAAEKDLEKIMKDYDEGKGGPQTKTALDRFIKEHPDNPYGYYFRSYYLQNEGQEREAMADLQKCLKLNPKFYVAINNLAWIKATSTDEKLRDGKEAVKLARDACELTQWKDAGMIDTLAAAYAETGDFELAVKWQEEAIHQFNPKTDKKEMLKGLKSRLELYQTGEPYREQTKKTSEAKPEEPAPKAGETVK